MTQISLDYISGVTYPVNIYMADIYGNNMTFITNISSGPIPPQVNYVTVPSILDTANEVMILLVDSNNCQKFEIVPCL